MQEAAATEHDGVLSGDDCERAFETEDLLGYASILQKNMRTTGKMMLLMAAMMGFINMNGLVNLVINLSDLIVGNNSPDRPILGLVLALVFLVPGLVLVGLGYSGWMNKRTDRSYQRIWDALPEEHQKSWRKHQDVIALKTENASGLDHAAHSIYAR